MRCRAGWKTVCREGIVKKYSESQAVQTPLAGWVENCVQSVLPEDLLKATKRGEMFE